MSTVSVIMPVYNGERFIGEAIESILSQTFTDFELIIVDDGSDDRSAEIIRSFQERDGRIQFIQLEDNMGPATARNCGIFASRGEYVTFMDCDDISLRERLDKQASFLDSHPQIGAVGICVQLVNRDLSTRIAEVNLPQRHCLIALDMFVGVGFVYATIMVRREFLISVGGYEPGRRAGEDRELPARMLWQTGIRFANLSDALLLYRRHEWSNSVNRDHLLQAQVLEVLPLMLQRIWNEAPEATMKRFFRMRVGHKFSWAERRAAKRDIMRLIESMIAAGWFEQGDRPQLIAAMNRRLERVSPRLWQRFCHWRRRHFGGPYQPPDAL